MACLQQLGRVPAAYAVVAGGCDWPLPSAVDLSNNDVIALRSLRCVRCVRCVGWKTRFRLLHFSVTVAPPSTSAHTERQTRAARNVHSVTILQGGVKPTSRDTADRRNVRL